MTAITIRQYRDSEPLALADSALAALVSRHAGKVDILPSGASSVVLRGSKYVGVLRVPELDVVIQPKIEPLAVFWLLGFAPRRWGFELEDFDFATEEGLLDVLARLYADRVERLILAGLYRAYVERTDTLPYVRGRILTLDDIRTQRGLRHRVTCRFSELTADVPHNRVLRSVTELLLRFQFRLPRVTRSLAWSAAHLAEVGPFHGGVREISSLTYNRLNDHYRPAHALAALILRHLSFRLASGGEAAPSFLVDMDLAFQDYVARIADEQARRQGLRVMQRPRRHLDREGVVAVEPDIVVGERQPLAVLDAKYKRHEVRADVYQALAYAKAYALRRVCLVYPEDGEVAPATHHIRNDDVTILVRTLPVGHHDLGFETLEARAAARMTGVLAELLAPDILAASA